MIEHQEELKLQAYLDGELPEGEAKQVTDWLARDQQAAALLDELRQTHKALAGFEDGIKVPESREFYWSKIQREIQLQDAAAERREAPVPLLLRLRRLLVPATGLALVVLLGLIATREAENSAGEMSAETALEDSGAFTYHDYSAGATLVWLSYPADDEAAEIDDLNSLD